MRLSNTPPKIIGLSRTGFWAQPKFRAFQRESIAWKAFPSEFGPEPYGLSPKDCCKANLQSRIPIKLPKLRVCTVAIKPGRGVSPHLPFVAKDAGVALCRPLIARQKVLVFSILYITSAQFVIPCSVAGTDRNSGKS